MIEQMEGQVALSDLVGWSGKTSQDHSVLEQPKEQTSKQSSRKSSGSSKQMPQMFLYLQMGSGQKQDASWVSEMTDASFPSHGEYMTLSFGEQPSMLMAECGCEALPSGVSVSRLSQILEDSADPKYYLSERACMGILNRAEKRGKELPEILKQALENQIRLSRSDS